MYFTSILIWYFVSMLYLINIHHCIFIQYLILSSSQWCIWSICVTTYLVLSWVGQVLKVYGLVKIRRWWTDSDDSAGCPASVYIIEKSLFLAIELLAKSGNDHRTRKPGMFHHLFSETGHKRPWTAVHLHIPGFDRTPPLLSFFSSKPALSSSHVTLSSPCSPMAATP